MAKEGAKKRMEDNEKKLKLYFQAACVSVAVHVAIRFALRYSTLGWSHVFGLLLGATMLTVSYRALQSAAEPTIGPAPHFEIIDGGADLGKPAGTLGPFQDMLWATVAVLPVAAVTRYAWFVGALLPLYMGYSTYKSHIAPMLGMGNKAPVSEADSELAQKRQAKAEKRSLARRTKRM